MKNIEILIILTVKHFAQASNAGTQLKKSRGIHKDMRGGRNENQFLPEVVLQEKDS